METQRTAPDTQRTAPKTDRERCQDLFLALLAVQQFINDPRAGSEASILTDTALAAERAQADAEIEAGTVAASNGNGNTYEHLVDDFDRREEAAGEVLS